ncbi:MAG TPA: DUF192 domain-containing protein, partial [Bryobacteraceae bacterium]|nr:DUF192 domain-containing protein [Bryobacteraceae bacterium]
MLLKRAPRTATAWLLVGIAVVAIFVVLLHRSASSHRVPSFAKIRFPNGDVIDAEVSDTWRAIERGLMGRESLPRKAGMLFVYPNTGRHRHWMYGCLIPLDLVWIGS